MSTFLILSLNPYYTGIHLHSNQQAPQKSKRRVLILIILEYIYMMKLKPWVFTKRFVLILIILEYIYINL